MLEKLPPDTEVSVTLGNVEKHNNPIPPPDNGLVNAVTAGMMAGAIAGSM